MKLIQDKTYPSMYWLEWPDKVRSADFYNITRAKDISKNLDEYLRNTAMQGNTRASTRNGRALDCIP